MQEYLRSSSDLVRPIVVKAGPSPDAGIVKTSFEEGSLFLRKAGRHYRVLFESKTKESPRVAPGVYELLGYRIRRTKDGTPWFISTTGPSGDKIKVPAGPTMVKVDPVIRVQVTARRKGNKANLRLALLDRRKAAITIYRDGKRIEAPYEIRDAKDQRIAAGKLAYG